MDKLLRKHFYKSGKVLVLILFSYSKQLKLPPLLTSFSLFTETNKFIIYLFIRNSFGFNLYLDLLLTMIFVYNRVKIITTVTDDILSFSLCENYMFNLLTNKNLENCLETNNKQYNNVSFYDYEIIRNANDL